MGPLSYPDQGKVRGEGTHYPKKILVHYILVVHTYITSLPYSLPLFTFTLKMTTTGLRVLSFTPGMFTLHPYPHLFTLTLKRGPAQCGRGQ